MSKLTRIADKTTSFEPISLTSGVARMLILLVAFGFYMAFISVSRTWIPVAQTEPGQTEPAEVEHQPIEKQEVVITEESEPTDEATNDARQERSAPAYVQQTRSQPEPRQREDAPTPQKKATQSGEENSSQRSAQGDDSASEVAPSVVEPPAQKPETDDEHPGDNGNGPVFGLLDGVLNGLDDFSLL